MELRDYLRVLRRRWKLVTVCLLVSIAVTSGITYKVTPQYTSTASLFVSTSPNNSVEAYQGGLFSTERVASYAELATKLKLSQEVVRDLDLTITPSELAGKIRASAAPDTVLLDLSVTDPDPEMAQKLTAAVADELTEIISEFETPPGSSNPILKASVAESATLPTVPSSPKTIRNLGLAIILGLMLGYAVAIVRELLDQTIKSADDAAEQANVAVMGGIAFDAAAGKTPLVTSLGSHAPRVEAFRVLRTNLQFVDVDSESKVFVVTSSVPGEGKSTTAVNLALTLAQSGQRVLLIDGDLRRPQVANMLQMEKAVGLTTVLVGNIDLDSAVQTHAETGLTVLTSGSLPPNPAELLQSRIMADVFDQARKQYDVVIIDSPPLLPVTDAALLTSQADGALVVVRYGKTTRDQLRGSRDRLDAVGGRSIGVLLNMVPGKRGGSGYGYGYGYGYAPEPQRRAR